MRRPFGVPGRGVNRPRPAGVPVVGTALFPWRESSMSSLADFVRLLLRDGRVILAQPPDAGPGHDPEAAAVLEQAFADQRLTVAGPLIDFDAPTALAAAALVRRACRFLVNRNQPAAELAGALAMPGPPRTPAQHLSADLTLRFLPQVHRRARALDPADPLPARLAEVLRRWPLAGVLAAVDEGPLTPPDFAGHPGLLLLYAERWSRGQKPAWMPRGPGRPYLELVWADLGRDPALLGEAAGVREEDGHE